MGLTVATLGGNVVTDARLTIPAWGLSWHDVSIDGEVTLSGRVTLVVADLTIQGTVQSGGPAAGRSFYRVVAGAGGWGKTLPAKSYVNDAGVKLSTVLGDAAAASGETLDLTSFDTSTRLGPAFVRPAGPACRVLELVAPSAWYVGEDGLTRLGARPASTLTSTAARTSQLDLARGTLELASETIAGILPGLVVDGLTVLDVEHAVSKDGLRSKVWGKQGGAASRRLSAMRKIVDQMDPDRKFRGVSEYRVINQTGERLNLQAVRASTGMPDLGLVFVRPGVPGAKASHTLGAKVLVGFVDADETRPVVLGFVDADDGFFLPISSSFDATTSVTIGASAGTVNVGAAPAPVAKSAAVLTSLTAIETWVTALNSALAAAPDPAHVATAMVTPTSTLVTALATEAAVTPTTVLKGT